MNYGFHRVISPKGLVPQAADTVDNSPKILHPSETLVSVKKLHLDSTSMRELHENYKDIPARILEIVNTRGKMHNPATNSGGVLLGSLMINGKGVELGNEEIVSLVSLSAIPLHLTSVKDIRGDTVCVEETAVLFDSYPYAVIPKDFFADLALSALDISSICPQLKRLLREGDSLGVIGCGKAGITAMAMARSLALQSIKIFGMDWADGQIEKVKSLGYADDVKKINAQNAEEVYKYSMSVTNDKGFDIVFNCVNVHNTETSSILATREGGIIVFFSMATEFHKAALGTDATGKDVTMLIGNGIAKCQSDMMFDLLRRDAKLRSYFESLILTPR